MVTGAVPFPLRFSLSIFIAHRVQQSHCSSICHRQLPTNALELSAGQFVHRKKSPRFYTSMHSGGLEIMKLTYTRLEDNLISHRGNRLICTTPQPRASGETTLQTIRTPRPGREREKLGGDGCGGWWRVPFPGTHPTRLQRHRKPLRCLGLSYYHRSQKSDDSVKNLPINSYDIFCSRVGTKTCSFHRSCLEAGIYHHHRLRYWCGNGVAGGSCTTAERCRKAAPVLLTDMAAVHGGEINGEINGEIRGWSSVAGGGLPMDSFITSMMAQEIIEGVFISFDSSPKSANAIKH